MKRTAIAVEDIKEGQIISFDRKYKSKYALSTYGTVVKVTKNMIIFKRGTINFRVRKIFLVNCKLCEK